MLHKPPRSERGHHLTGEEIVDVAYDIVEELDDVCGSCALSVLAAATAAVICRDIPSQSHKQAVAMMEKHITIAIALHPQDDE